MFFNRCFWMRKFCNEKNLVRDAGLEPARLAALEPKSNASANSASRAQQFYNILQVI